MKKGENIILKAVKRSKTTKNIKNRSYMATAGMTLFFILGMWSVSEAFLSTFALDLNMRLFVIFLVVICLYFVLLYNKWYVMKLSIIPVLSLYLTAVFMLRSDIASGLKITANAVINQINQYYHINLLRFNVSSESIIAFWLVIQFPLAALLAYEVTYKFHGGVYFTLSLLVICAAMLVGKVPDFPSMIVILFVTVSLIASSGRHMYFASGGKYTYLSSYQNAKKNKKKRHYQAFAAICMAGLCILTMAVSALTLWPVVDNWFESSNEKIMRMRTAAQDDGDVFSVISQLISSDASGGINGGELGKTDGFSYTGAVALEITTESMPKEAVYLRAYVGEVYDGESWKNGNGTDLSVYLAQNNINMTNPFMRVLTNGYFQKCVNLHADEEIVPYTFEIRRRGASSSYVYSPYYLYDDGSFTWFDDNYFAGTGRELYWFSFMPRMSVDIENNLNAFVSKSIVENGDQNYVEVENIYTTFVKENYLSYPKERLPRLEAQCSALKDNFKDVISVKNYVQSSLYEAATYNANVGKLPPGKEYTEYFLYEQKEGYCSHFATAAVLMFRMLGVPARYVTGYIAPASDFKREPEGVYVASIIDKRAHAWPEIYVHGVGWMPIEVTPGYVRVKDANAEKADVAPKNNENNNTPDFMENIKDKNDKPDEKKDEKEEEPAGVLSKLVLAALVILALSVAACLVRREVLLRRHRAMISGRDTNKVVRGVFRKLYDMMILSGFPKNVECSDDRFPGTVELWYPVLNDGEFEEFMDSVIRANYGQEGLPKSEAVKARRIYDKVVRYIYSKASFPKKMIIRFVKVYC